MKFWIALVYIIIIMSSCSEKGRYIDATMVERLEKATSANGCDLPENHEPSELTPMRYIRMNFHVLQRADGSGNFTEEEAKLYIKRLLYQANYRLLGRNKKMNLPEGNDTPVLPQRFQYVLTPDGKQEGDDGIYLHKDEELYYMIKDGEFKNYYTRDVIEKYAVNNDTVLNIFLLEHHADSIDSNTYKDGDMGVAIGTSVKILGAYRNNNKKIGKTTKGAWFTQGLLNHEVGHVLGLGHSWVKYDRCDDTPVHTNCWNFGAPPCDKVSNNVMDYNTYREAWTPCQLGMVHRNFSRKNSKQRKLLRKTWCKRDLTQTVMINGDEVWEGSRDLAGDLIIKGGAKLSINCRVSMPEKSKLIVEPGAQLILGESGVIENDCGKEWEGIFVLDRKGKKGKVSCGKSAIIRNAKHKVNL